MLGIQRSADEEDVRAAERESEIERENTARPRSKCERARLLQHAQIDLTTPVNSVETASEEPPGEGAVERHVHRRNEWRIALFAQHDEGERWNECCTGDRGADGAGGDRGDGQCG